ncbi:type IV pilin protein, partial [Acinetobacter junii]|uniref:type IV pilin protein n=1 Tax=Acinetobacter junii TaxID=40215 RepID=UPI0030FC2A36
MKKNHGFTLIELMIVVVIVAIFAAIAFPSYQQYIELKDLAIARQEALRIAA